MSDRRLENQKPASLAADGRGAVAAAFRLGAWTVRPEQNEVERGRETRRLQHTEMLLLVFLAESAGRDLSKSEILRGVWGEGFHSPEVLTVAVSKLRKTLDDDSKSPWLIKTLPRLGYRMIQAPRPLVASSPDGASGETLVARWARRLGPRFMVVSFLLLLLLVAVILQVLVEILAT